MRWNMRRPSGACEMPRWTISWGGVSPTSSPSKLIDPSRGGVRPEIERKVVDLPAPFEPMRVTISPSLTSIEMPLRASMFP